MPNSLLWGTMAINGYNCVYIAGSNSPSIGKRVWSIVQTISLAVAPSTSIVHDNGHLIDGQPCDSIVRAKAYCVKCRKYIVPWQYLSIDSVPSLLSSTTFLNRQLCQHVVVKEVYRQTVLPVYCGSQCLSLPSVASLLSLTISIDTRFFGATVAAMLYFLCIVQGICTSYLICPMMLTAHCPKDQHLLLPTLSIDRQRGQTIVVDNVDNATHLTPMMTSALLRHTTLQPSFTLCHAPTLLLITIHHALIPYWWWSQDEVMALLQHKMLHCLINQSTW